MCPPHIYIRQVSSQDKNAHGRGAVSGKSIRRNESCKKYKKKTVFLAGKNDFSTNPFPFFSSGGPPQITVRDKCSRPDSYDYLSPQKRRACFPTSPYMCSCITYEWNSLRNSRVNNTYTLTNNNNNARTRVINQSVWTGLKQLVKRKDKRVICNLTQLLHSWV